MLSAICLNLDHSKILSSGVGLSADNKFIITLLIGLFYERSESTVGKGENAGYEHFLLFPQCFQQASCLGQLKVGIVW